MTTYPKSYSMQKKKIVNIELLGMSSGRWEIRIFRAVLIPRGGKILFTRFHSVVSISKEY